MTPVPGRMLRSDGTSGGPGGRQTASGRTPWARNLQTPLREFLRTETGGAVVLLAATLVALAWANVQASTYQTFWGMQVSVRVGDAGISQDLRQWVNGGLMTLFWFVVGLEEAKLGILSAALCASVVTWAVVRGTALLPPRWRTRALLGTAELIVDLAAPVDPDRDHIRGPEDAPVTVVEYGDFECPYCGQAEPAVRELLAGHGDVRYVWRHLPLSDVHAQAQLAAQAAEAAAEQGAFWEMHDLLFRHQDALQPRDLVRYAGELGLDIERFRDDLRRNTGAARVMEDVDSADLSGVAGTPTFFINGRRHHGAYDIATLSAAVETARNRAAASLGVGDGS
jgi:protein-disulfide isomerase